MWVGPSTDIFPVFLMGYFVFYSWAITFATLLKNSALERVFLMEFRS